MNPWQVSNPIKFPQPVSIVSHIYQDTAGNLWFEILSNTADVITGRLAGELEKEKAYAAWKKVCAAYDKADADWEKAELKHGYFWDVFADHNNRIEAWRQ